MTLKEITDKLQDPETPPGELSAMLMFLSALYAMKSAEWTEILTIKATAWEGLRKDAGSDKQADKAWDATPNGIMDMGLRLQLKSLEKLMSALKTHLRVKEVESKNLF